MHSFNTLRQQLLPLLHTVVEQAQLLIFPTDITGDLAQTDTLLHLQTATGSFILGVQSDGQTPQVDETPAFAVPVPGVTFAQRQRAWMAGVPLAEFTYECFSSTEFDWLRCIEGARVQEINILEYITGGLTGLQLVCDRLTLYSVPGAGGNRVLPALPPQYFPEAVRVRSI